MQTYLVMVAYCENQNYSGIAHFYLQQVEEERFHAMKIYQYLNNHCIKTNISAIHQSQTGFDSVLGTFDATLTHEKSSG